MANPEYLKNCLEGSLIPEGLLGKTISIPSGDGRKLLELRCESLKPPKDFFESIFGRPIFRKPIDKTPQPRMMSLSLSTRWGGGYRNIITASVKENPATGKRQLGVSLTAIPESDEGDILRGTHSIAYTTENCGRLSSRLNRVESEQTLQLLSEKGMFGVAQLPKRIDLEATLKGFLADFQEMLARQASGQVPDDFPTPRLVPA